MNWAERSVEELGLSVRSSNALDRLEIRNIQQLCAQSEKSLLKARNFGRRSLREVKRKLEELGLSLGMPMPMALPDPVPETLGLRDYFAAQAMAELTADAIVRMREMAAAPPHRTGMDDVEWNDESKSTWAEGIALEAYVIADAMLLVRGRTS